MSERSMRRAESPAGAPRETCPPGLVPIDDLGSGFYGQAQGGLYPAGSNVRPPAHAAAGLALACSVCPLDTAGAPDPEGRIGLLSIGMSNASAEFRTFERLARSDPDKNARLVIVDGAQDAAGASRIASDDSSGGRYWDEVDRRLRAFGVAPTQVQVAWVKVAEGYPVSPFPDHALRLKGDLQQIVQTLRQRFLNLRLAYCSSRIFGGYASGPLNPEPFAYESGFAVKWLIEDQINAVPDLNFNPARGPLRAPWLAWGPYLWANGLVPRSDGLTYARSDLAVDGTHPGAGACRRVAQKLHGFFTTDITARRWFVRPALPDLRR